LHAADFGAPHGRENEISVNGKPHGYRAVFGIQNRASFKRGDLERFEVVTMTCIKMAVLRNVAGCTLVDGVPKFLRI